MCFVITRALRTIWTGTGRFAHHRRDGIALPNREEVEATEEPWRKVAPSVIMTDENGDVFSRTGDITVADSMPALGPASQAYKCCSITATTAAKLLRTRPEERQTFDKGQSRSTITVTTYECLEKFDALNTSL